MQDHQQFEQLMLRYNQLLNGTKDIEKMIDNEDYDTALSFVTKQRDIFVNCNNILKYLELTDDQREILNKVKQELTSLTLSNMEKINNYMANVQGELSKIKNLQKFQNAYENNLDTNGSIIDFNE